jgi:hypothetical protein
MQVKQLITFIVLFLILTACVSRRDAMEPMITIVDPANGTTGNSGNIRVEGYAMDDGGITAIRVGDVDLMQSDVLRNDRGKKLVEFAFQANLSDTERFSRNITVEDTSGRTKTLLYELVIDKTPPTIEITEARDLGNGTMRVVGIARDNIAVQSIDIAGVPLPFISQAEQPFNTDVPTSESMQIVVMDSAGNAASQPLP